MATKVTYSLSARLGGGGIGDTAFQAVKGIYNAGYLNRLFISSNAQSVIPSQLIRAWGFTGRALKYLAAKDSSGLINYLENLLFDAWVNTQLPDTSNIFHGWNGTCLWTLRRAKQQGMRTVVERASSHPATFKQLLQEEYQRWGLNSKLPTWNYQRVIRELEEADYITIPSQFVQDSMVAAGIPVEKLINIPFGVDLSRFAACSEPSAHPFRVIYVGRVSVPKGIPYLLEAWRQLKWQAAELWLVGVVTGDLSPLLNRWANLPGLRLLGHLSNIAQLLSQSDLFVFPSIQEGSALAVYEAMAAGLPVITTPNAGSIVRDGQEGFITPIRDVEALCTHMQRLYEDAELRAYLSQAARKRAEDFSWDHYRQQLINYYEQI